MSKKQQAITKLFHICAVGRPWSTIHAVSCLRICAAHQKRKKKHGEVMMLLLLLLLLLSNSVAKTDY